MSSLHVKDAPVAYTGITSSAALPHVLSEIKREVGPGGPDTSPHCCLGPAFLLSALTPVCSCGISPGDEFSAQALSKPPACKPLELQLQPTSGPEALRRARPRFSSERPPGRPGTAAGRCPAPDPRGGPCAARLSPSSGLTRTQGPRTPTGMRLGLEVWGGGQNLPWWSVCALQRRGPTPPCPPAPEVPSRSQPICRPRRRLLPRERFSTARAQTCRSRPNSSSPFPFILPVTQGFELWL